MQYYIIFRLHHKYNHINHQNKLFKKEIHIKNVDITIYSENRFFVITNIITNFWVNNICLKLGR